MFIEEHYFKDGNLKKELVYEEENSEYDYSLRTYSVFGKKVMTSNHQNYKDRKKRGHSMTTNYYPGGTAVLSKTKQV